MTLVAADNTIGLAAVLLCLLAAGFTAEKTRWGRAMSAPLIILLGGVVLSNVGVIPHTAPMLDITSTVFVPMAVPLLLMRADLVRVFRESGATLIAFFVAIAATVAAAYIAASIVNMGEMHAELVGTLTGSFIGGSINFLATSQAVGLDSSSVYVAALSAASVGAVIYLALLMSLPSLPFLLRLLPSKFIQAALDGDSDSTPESMLSDRKPFDLRTCVNGLALALVICAVSRVIVDALGIGQMFILMVTIMSLLVANFGKRLTQQVSADFEIGTLLMFTFFGAIGAGAELSAILGAALPILLFVVVLFVAHLSILLLLSRLLKLDLAEAMIASNACILGPATAAAMAASRGWRDLVTPGMLVGILGYSVGTFFGVAVAHSLM